MFSLPVAVGIAGIVVVNAVAVAQNVASDKPAGVSPLCVYVGTYTNTGSKGIYLLRLDPAAGRLKMEGIAAEVANPSFLALHPTGRYLYAVGEIADFQKQRSGAVSAFAIDRERVQLTPLNQQPSGGTGPCHLSVDPAGRNVLVANYGSGSVAVLPIREDGRLGPSSAQVQHEGSGPNQRRQDRPHAHSIHVDPAGRFAFAADLGADKLFIYRFDAREGKLSPADPPAVATVPGGGPRHFAMHPNGRLAFVNNELTSSVTAFGYDPEKGSFTRIVTRSTLPDDFQGENTTSEVQVHPSGRFLYVSNRGHDSIAIFSIDADTGRLEPLGHEPTQGKTPRNFGIEPAGRYLLAANQHSDSIVVFRIDAETGKLEPTGSKVEVPAPACIRFWTAP